MDKESLREKLISEGLAIPGPELDMLMELFDTYSTQVRIDELKQAREFFVNTGGRLTDMIDNPENHYHAKAAGNLLVGFIDKRIRKLSTTKHNTSKE